MDLPTILSGPILRRVEPSHVYIWIALKKRYKLSATIYQIDNLDQNQSLSYQEIDSHSETTTIRVGKNLYISLLKITPVQGPFPRDSLLGYNLFFHSNSRILDLEDFGLLDSNNPDSIVYGDLAYPSFYIPSTEQTTNLLYGSCRKLHGKGVDALSQGDRKLENDFFRLEKRPQALFLLGDQIYADDVPDPIFPIMIEASKQLIGKEEDISQLDSRLKEEPFNESIHQIRGRQFIMERFCKFTSSHSFNHAMTLGEFAALYLMSWSPALLDAYLGEGLQLPSFEDMVRNDEIYFVYEDNNMYKDEREKEIELLRKRYEEHVEDVKKTYRTLSKVRRLLANTPTYMIFDDHDITDDWNLSFEWKRNVHQSRLGRHVIANGLTSYFLFQGWGNDPETIELDFLRNLWKYFKSYQLPSAQHEIWENQLLQYDSWNFVAPTNPKAIFLDTRTQREFDHNPLPVKFGRKIEERERPPKLIGKQGWKAATECLFTSGWSKGDPLIVVSSGPVYGIGIIESFLHQYVYPLKIVGVQVNSTFDFEAWKYNAEGFSDFLYQLKRWKPSHCFILSGDVHYASAVTTTVQFQDGDELLINQFTSSPMNNMSFTGIWGSLMKLIVSINAAKRRNKEINRYCDDTFNLIQQQKNNTCPSTFTWREKIRYLSTDSGSIMVTENNIGHLKVTEGTVQNSLLQEGNESTFIPVTFDKVNK